MATIKEVAKLAGVSISTVSRALSKKVFVEETTRERVLKAVKQLSYKPNLMAKGLKEGHSRTLALVLPDILNPFFPTMIRSLERQAAERDYSIILYDCGGDIRQEEKYIETLKSHYVDGVVYFPTGHDVSQAGTLFDHNIPVVAMSRLSDTVPSIITDSVHGAHTVIDYLVKHGHTRISAFMGPLGQFYFRQRYEGCLEAFKKNGIDDYERYMVRDVDSIETAYARTKQLMAISDRPTAVFAFTDLMAMGVYSGIHDSGLSIPDDVSVVGFDNIYLCRHLIPPLTTYEQPTDKMARLAIENLLHQIEGTTKPESGHHVVKGSLIVRKSVKEQS